MRHKDHKEFIDKTYKIDFGYPDTNPWRKVVTFDTAERIIEDLKSVEVENERLKRDIPDELWAVSLTRKTLVDELVRTYNQNKEFEAFLEWLEIDVDAWEAWEESKQEENE